jgi:hypothetical protein
MPYIDPKERKVLDPKITKLAYEIKLLAPLSEGPVVESAGRLNYAITRLVLGVYPHKKYWVMAIVCGVLINVLLEYYRRWAAPYEDDKIAENGDVY